jgi:nitronate monooxygenase
VFELVDLVHPIIAAPMAGGPSTPQLVAAVGEAGGLGFLAGGYRSADELASEVAAVRELTDRPFGVNLFVPGEVDRGRTAGRAWDDYRAALGPLAATLGAALPKWPRWHDDDFAAKLARVFELRPALVSFTFGLPESAVINQLREAGIVTVATVTAVTEARLANDQGMDILCVQGPEAGGHRASFTASEEPSDLPLDALVRGVREESDRPIIAAGGVDSRARAAGLLSLGASAVQVGTMFLGAAEAGTKPVHLRSLVEGHGSGTVITRAFTGRPARALRNAFTNQFDVQAPALYPELHYLTAPIRAAAAAADDPANLNLWTGAGYRSVRPTTAGAIVQQLTPADHLTPLEPPPLSSRGAERSRVPLVRK